MNLRQVKNWFEKLPDEDKKDAFVILLEYTQRLRNDKSDKTLVSNLQQQLEIRKEIRKYGENYLAE